MKQEILLYYKYVTIADPARLLHDQKALCNRLHLKGRIIVAHEGINGTVAGTAEATQAYQEAMHALPEFADMEFKLGEDENQVFPKMSIKLRNEIVTLQAPIAIDMNQTGTYLEPDEMHELLSSGEEIVVVDARNNYESKIGRFKNAITPDIDNFRDWPQAVSELEHLKDKKVVTYCTGGIRCEKASAYLRQQGFKHVYQLHGGIIKYIEKHPEFGFDGHCYVFDGRISVKANDNIITNCEYCGIKTAHYPNCTDNICHRQFICCESCETEHQGICHPDHHLQNVAQAL